jgi:predicted TIM-barrel fold metal-dependent hydrolase
MAVLDAFSFFDRGHPVTRPGANHYLLAPPRDDACVLAEFRRTLADFPRALGGLLPLLGPDDAELADALDDGWWQGLLLAPAAGENGPDGLTAARVFEILQWPEAESLPLVVECGREGFSRPPHLAAFLDRCSPRPILLTHGAQLNISGGHLEAAEGLFSNYPHTLLETSGIYRQDFLETMVREIGASRILYGSGYPGMDEELELERVAILPLGDRERAAIEGDNARRVFGL